MKKIVFLVLTLMLRPWAGPAAGYPLDASEETGISRLEVFMLAESVLLEQPFVKEPKQTVGQFAKEHGVEVKQFIHWELGRGEMGTN